MIGSILVDLTTRDDLCILLIEHDLDFVREISSLALIVLHQGRVLLDGSVQEVVRVRTRARDLRRPTCLSQ